MKTHYTTVDLGNESQPNDEWADTTLCGIQYWEGMVSDNPKYVTCKRCLSRLIIKNTTHKETILDEF